MKRDRAAQTININLASYYSVNSKSCSIPQSCSELEIDLKRLDRTLQAAHRSSIDIKDAYDFYVLALKEFNKENTQLGKIYQLGPIAFRNRDSGELWREGVWARPGDFVRIPKWGGDRFTRVVPGTTDTAIFCIFSDHELIAKVDPEAFEELDEVK